jgi:hypothetical protein
MRKREALTRRERRQFDDLVKAYYELEAVDPHLSDEPAIRPEPPSPGDRES